MNPRFLVLFCSFILTFMVSFSTAFAEEQKKAAPIYIEANNMISTESSSSVVFTGDVDAKQGDVRIRADKMTVYYTQTGTGSVTEGNGEQDVDKIVCVGNVEITRGEWLGTGGKMTYTAKDRKIVLTDNAKAWQGQNVITGDSITYYLDEKRSEVESGSKTGKKPSRVNMTIIQK